jgi:class 3 adenylate cyclase
VPSPSKRLANASLAGWNAGGAGYVVEVPKTRYARTVDGISIAYSVLGEGPIDMLWVSGFQGNLEVMWEQPLVVAFFVKLASFSRVIFHDRRATGLSDRATALPDLETRVDDIRTVLDAAASPSTVILGSGEGVHAAALFASTFPRRTRALVLYAASARGMPAPDYPWGLSEDERAHDTRLAEDAWGTEAYAASVMAEEAPSTVGDRAFVRWYAKVMRHWVSPSSAAELTRIFYETDIRSVLPTVRVPTLVLCRAWTDSDEDEYVASLVPDASLVRLTGEDTSIIVADPNDVADAIRNFIGLERPPEELDRVLRTVMFTDIVGSTQQVAELGDRGWGELVERHHATVRAMLARYRGTEVDTAGDGFFATFDGPARALRCAQSIIETVRPLGIEVRVGLHTGEVETIAGTVGGLAVVIGARVGAIARASEVLATSTVKDLTAGSGLVFEDAGEHELKGVPDRWHLYRVVNVEVGKWSRSNEPEDSAHKSKGGEATTQDK